MQVKLGVRNHMRLKQAGDTGVHVKDKTLLKFRNEMGEQLENVLNLMHADNISHSDASSIPNQITNIRQRLEQLKNVPTRPKIPIDGFDLTLMGLKPGPIFKEIMNTVAEAWYRKTIIDKKRSVRNCQESGKNMIKPNNARHELMWYYGWDVASGCVWNLSNVKLEELND